MRKIIFLLAAVLCLAACKNDDDETPVSKTSRTVLIYMSGENNLTVNGNYRFLYSDLQEIIKGSKQLAANQRLLVFVDSLNTNILESGKPYIMEVQNGTAKELYRFNSDFYASDPAKFREILRWTIDNAPAESYGLVLWGHATGWAFTHNTVDTSVAGTRAYGLDTGKDVSSYNTEKWMNITQMAEVLSEIPKLEFIFADCCNMMCAEVGYELRNATKYLIGSPAEIPGEGAPYNLIVPQFFKQGSELYKGIIDTYYNYYNDYGSYSVPLSVIDTQHMEALAQATHDILGKFTEPYPVYPSYPSLEKDSVVFYWYYDAPMMYDMRAVMKTYAPTDVFEQWDKTYQQAVPYYRMAMRWETIYSNLLASFRRFKSDASQNGCVSMFIPRNTKMYFDGDFHYNLTYNKFGWNRVIDWSRFGWDDSVTAYQ